MSSTSAAKRESPGFVHRVKKVLVAILLTITGLFWLIPGFGLLVTSFRPTDKVNASGWWTVVTDPSQLTISSYVNTLGSNGEILGAAWVSLAITVPATIMVVLFASLAAYALSWIDFAGRDSVFIVMVGLLVVPLQMALIPAFQVFRWLGISGVPAIWLFHTAFGLPFAIFLLRNFMVRLPVSLLDAARLDGASEFTIFRKIVLPLSWPAVASLTIFQFTWTWNDLLVALVFSSTDDKPLTVFLQNKLGSFSSDIDVISSGVFISALLPLLVFFKFQKHFEAGLLGGATK